MEADWDWIRQLGAVALVMGLLAAAMWALRQAGWFHAGMTGLGSNAPFQAEASHSAAGKGSGPVALLRKWFGAHLQVETESATSRKIRSLDRLALTPQHSLHVIRVGQRDLLLATHPQGCVLVADLGTSANAENASQVQAKGDIPIPNMAATLSQSLAFTQPRSFSQDLPFIKDSTFPKDSMFLKDSMFPKDSVFPKGPCQPGTLSTAAETEPAAAEPVMERSCL